MKRICLVVFAGIVLIAALSGCISTTKSPGKAQYVDITAQQAKEMIDRGEVFILDVRTQEEYGSGHIKGSTLIPVLELGKRLNEIPRDKKILVYCKSGHRSLQASDILVSNGFAEVYNMDDGIAGWVKARYEVVK